MIVIHQKTVAVVGVGAILPDAPDAPTFWKNIQAGRYSITDVPPDRWNPADYYDPDPRAIDKTYTKIGAWVRDFKFESLKWRLPIPPKVLAVMDETQQWAIAASRAALLDYGYPDRFLDTSRTAVIFGNAMAGEKQIHTVLRIYLPEYLNILGALPEFQELSPRLQATLLGGLQSGIRARIPAVTEDTMPGELSNIIAGRVANVFDLRGPNFVTDAACASSFAALQPAVDGLISGRFDAVLTGGVERNMGVATFVKFCKIGALSPDGSRPYAEGANGFVMGEGAVIFLLKRLADAERDGDKIYAVIRGIGGSSDGKGKGITAPNPLGPQRAIERAWQDAGVSPATATYIEGHGTSTAVGDVAELQSMALVFEPLGLPVGHIALGSVKSNVGHLKSAAGAVGMLKTIYALHDKLLPPTVNFTRPNPKIDFAHLPFYVNTELRPWPRPNGNARRAGVSTLGFGGANFHVVLEEYLPGRLTSTSRSFPIPAGTPGQNPGELGPVSFGHSAQNLRRPCPSAVPTAAKAPYRGILALGADSPAALRQQLAAARDRAQQGETPFLQLPAPSALGAQERLVIDFGNAGELAARGEKAAQVLEKDAPGSWRLLASQGIFRGRGKPGQVAFLFPGQGAQYVNMLRELRDLDPVIAATFREADEVMQSLWGRPLSDYIFVDGDKAALAQAERELRNTVITQPAVLTVNVALMRLLESYGLVPDMVIGHSLGEYAALVTAGVLTFGDALQVVSARGREMSRVSLDDNGCMAAISAPLPEVERILAGIEGYVVLANINSPVQSVIGGETPAVKQALVAFNEAGYRAVQIPVSHAFHTRIVALASIPLREIVAEMDIRPPQLPVVANVTGELYPHTREEIVELLAQQVASPVQFIQGVETLYREGVRVFVEVGPKRVLSALVGGILKERDDVTLLCTNHPRKGDLPSFNEALCALASAGISAVAAPAVAVSPTAPLTAPPAAAPAAVAAPPTVSPAASPDPVAQRIVEMISEQTGYPPEMLDLDLDLEADLGIDTVKQAEFFAALRETFDISRREDLVLADYNTLEKVIQFIHDESRAGQPEAGAPPTTEAAVLPVTDIPASPYPRRVPAPVLRPRIELCTLTGVAFAAGMRVVVVGDRGKVGDSVARRLRARKVQVLMLQDAAPDAAAAQVETWLTEGPVDGVYFLPALDVEPPLETLNLETWHAALDRRVKTLYALLHKLPGDVFLVCGTRMGGLHGYTAAGATAPLGGAVTGFAKAYAQERAAALVKAVDFAPESDDREIAAQLIEETLRDPAVVEVGRHGDQRFGIGLLEQPSAAGRPLGPGAVFVVTGGAGGITVPIVVDLARASRGTFYLTGRAPFPNPANPDLARLQNDRDGLKRELAQRMIAAGQKPTPVKVERELAALEHAAAILTVLEAVRRAGGTAHYVACDVTDADAVARLLQEAERAEGRVDVILHAAGIERSRRLEDKTPEEFERVFAVKADGAFNLLKAMGNLARAPQAVIAFSSVAARFGNAGQSDYSATNDLLCKLLSALRTTHPDIKALALDWSAWAEVGMASRGSIPRIMRLAGIEMLRPEAAAPLVRRELLADGPGGEVVLAGDLGLLTAPRTPAGGLDMARANAALTAGHPPHVMLNHVTGLDLYRGITLEAELDPQSEPFLRDHALKGIPVLPGVMGIEGFSVAAQYIASALCSDGEGFRVTGLEDIRFLTALKFYRKAPRRIVWRVLIAREASRLVARVTLESTRAHKSGREEHTLHFSGRVCLEPLPVQEADVPLARPPVWNGAATVDAEAIYRLYFHGPAFRVLDGVQRVGDRILGRLQTALPPATSQGQPLAVTPRLLELCFQTAGIWEAGVTGFLGLPASIEQLVLYEREVDGSPIYAEVNPMLSQDNRPCFAARVVDAQGHLYLELKGYRTSPFPGTIDSALLQPLRALVEGEGA